MTLDGVALPVAASAVQVGDASITRESPSVVHVSTPQLRLSLVNSDWFINVESAALLVPYSSELQLQGLLGQTADPHWQPHGNSARWRQHLEQDHMLRSQDLFGHDFKCQEDRAKAQQQQE